MKKTDSNIISISIFTIWLFQISGALGIVLGNAEWFIPLTPLCLSIFLLLIYINNRPNNYQFFIISYSLGALCELIGVNTGILFGNYSYGDTLGLKLFNVPLVMGVNWFITVYISSSIADKIVNTNYLKIILSLLLILFLDICIEPVAPKMDMWKLTGYEHAPITNYITWAFIALPLIFIYFKQNIKTNFYLSLNIYFSQILFFIAINIFFN